MPILKDKHNRMHAGPKFRPFNVPAEELDKLLLSDKKPIFRSRLLESNFSTAYKKAALTLEEIRPFQIAAAWRLVRTHAMSKYQIGDMEPLSNVTDAQWVYPMPDASPSSRTTLSKGLGDIWAGLPLLPCKKNKVEFAEAVTKASRLLNLRHNPREPVMGNVSLFGFDDSRTIVRFFPTKLEIATHEQEFMSVIAAELLYRGHVTLISDLQARDGFSRAEALSLIPLARNFCIQGIELDLEFDQKMMVARTEGYIQRAQDAADLRGEIQGLKHLSTIQGLARIEPVDPMHEFATLVQDLTDEDKEEAKQIEAAS